MPPFSPGDRVVVIGAGATRGASTSRRRVVRPPLNNDFFTQLQRVEAEKHRDLVDEVISDVTQLFGSNFSLTMEDYFSQLASIERMNELTGRAPRRFNGRTVAEMRKSLRGGLAAVLEASTDVSKKGTAPCAYHGVLVEHLNPRDTVISFNYDCVMDHALRRCASTKWSALYGYGFDRPRRTVTGDEYWSAARPPRSSAGSVNLLKLHGSLNWQFVVQEERTTVRLKQRLYQQHGIPRFEIIPPEAAKDLTQAFFPTLWSRAEAAIRNAKQVSLIGFSFTPTDQHVEALFRLALADSRRLKALDIANPSRQHRERIRAVFSRPLQRGLRLRQYDSLGDYAAHVARGAWP